MAQQWSSTAIGYSRKNIIDPVPEIVFTEIKMEFKAGFSNQLDMSLEQCFGSMV